MTCITMFVTLFKSNFKSQLQSDDAQCAVEAVYDKQCFRNNSDELQTYSHKRLSVVRGLRDLGAEVHQWSPGAKPR